MTIGRSFRPLRSVVLVGAAYLCLATGIAAAQISGPPPGQPPAGPPFGGAPPGGGAGPPGSAGGGPGPPPLPPLTEAQKIVAALPPPMQGGLLPQPPLPPDAPPPAADPRDLQGAWYHNQPLEARAQKDMYGWNAPYNMAGVKVISRRVDSLRKGKPFVNASAKCVPPGPQWQRDLNFPFQIVQGKTWVEFIFEEYHGRWNISLDTAATPLPTGPEYMGRSVGHWEGDTLVVESSGFKQALWLDVDGTPLSANGKLIQRIRKVDLGNGKPFLEIITTIVDPTYYTDPWSVVRTFGWHPGVVAFKEYNCEEQVGDPGTDANTGLVPEPAD